MPASVTTMPLNQPYPWYEFTQTVGGGTYTFEVYYNTRADRWRLNIKDVTGVPVLMGIPLLIERDLVSQYRYLEIPAGYFVVMDGKKKLGTQPGLSGFALNHSLYHFEIFDEDFT